MSKKPLPNLPETKRLLAEIEAFLDATGMAPSTFGHRVANDGKLVDRLRSGWRTVNVETAAVIRAYIANYIERSGDPYGAEEDETPGRPKKVAA